MSCSVTSCEILSHHVTSHHIMSCHVRSCHIISRHIISSRIIIPLQTLSTPCRRSSGPLAVQFSTTSSLWLRLLITPAFLSPLERPRPPPATPATPSDYFLSIIPFLAIMRRNRFLQLPILELSFATRATSLLSLMIFVQRSWYSFCPMRLMGTFFLTSASITLLSAKSKEFQSGEWTTCHKSFGSFSPSSSISS